MSDSGWPPVSVVIPTRDRPVELERAVRSVLSQDYQGHLECTVVFDQEQPKPLSAVVPPGYSLRSIENVRSPGLAGARNTGAAQSSGDLLAWCDDDDEWLPHKLTRQVQALRGSPDAGVATCGIAVCVGRRRVARVPRDRVVARGDLLRSRQMWVHSSTLVVRRDRFFGDIGPVDETIPGSYGEDYEWVVRASKWSPIVAVLEPLVLVHWQRSYYAQRWDTMTSAIRYHLEKHPELAHDPRNAARMYGRLAFAYGASGRHQEARRWARRSIDLDWRQPRGYLAMLVSLGLLSPRWVTSLAAALGRGV
ncbi:MAG TPA: glycosyltransferase family 2 protein [Actinomycetota bacterium]|nr:glycosyltransferase family 2 protein [Actinomycetota bacterium]